MASLLGHVSDMQGRGWRFAFGTHKEFDRFFSNLQHGSSAKAKAAALAYQKDPKLQKKLQTIEFSGPAKRYGISVEEWVKKSAAERKAMSNNYHLKLRLEAQRIKNIAARTFTHKNKTYVIPLRAHSKVIPWYKKFLKSITDYVINRKPGTSVLESIQTIPGYKQYIAQKNSVLARLFQDLQEYFSKWKKAYPHYFAYFVDNKLDHIATLKQ